MFSDVQAVTTAAIPAIVVRNMIPLPNNEIKIDTVNSKFIQAINASVETNKYIAILVPKVPTSEEMLLKNINPVGIVAKVISTV